MYPDQLTPLLLPPKGVLFHGPPGCGKTLLAKAISTQVKANFLNLDISIVRNKWFGETEKFANAVFTLAYKLQPCIIFLDEVDSFLSTRDQEDHAADASLKSIFLQKWDGLTTDSHAKILILAATNRMESVDAAILRRLPLKFLIPLPTLEDRLQILKIHLKFTPLATDVDLEEIALMTQGLSGSDLQEICRCASVLRVVDYMAAPGISGTLRNLSMQDLKKAYAITTTQLDKSTKHMYI